MKEILLKKIEMNRDLPPLPNNLLKLVECVNNSDSEIEDIAEIIQADSVLSGRLIKVSNSVLFGGGRDSIFEVNDAIMRMGRKVVMDLAYTVTLPNAFHKPKGFKQQDFWQHSLAAGYISRELSQRIKTPPEVFETSYISGLMNNVGILVFEYLIPTEYSEFLSDIKDVDEPLEQLELKRFGIAHPELGARFIKTWWYVSDKVVWAVLGHHKWAASKDVSVDTSNLVNAADMILSAHEITTGIGCHRQSLDQEVLECFDLGPPEIEDLMEKTQEMLQQVTMSFNV